ncbi:MAG: type II toxin-antitoxin system RelB/DinJ family antitoxin [Propionibacteriaceae bacterium]|jgi:DNA-damage-inducible protein J|nr:type II toxin-antitoxin system RelB/DinJ family antitoxin [Propionibacteriaceae bacterium]
MASTTLTVRMDSDLKAQAEKIFHSMGLNFTTAFTIFTRRVVQDREIPFTIKAEEADPFYDEANQRHLKQVLDEARNGHGLITKTMDELEMMARD